MGPFNTLMFEAHRALPGVSVRLLIRVKWLCCVSSLCCCYSLLINCYHCFQRVCLCLHTNVYLHWLYLNGVSVFTAMRGFTHNTWHVVAAKPCSLTFYLSVVLSECMCVWLNKKSLFQCFLKCHFEKLVSFLRECVCVCVCVCECVYSKCDFHLYECLHFLQNKMHTHEAVWKRCCLSEGYFCFSIFSNELRIKVTEVLLKCSCFLTYESVSHVYGIFEYLMISLFISLRVCAFMYMQVCKPIWLGLYDDRNLVIPDFRELQKLKEFLQDKYEKKRW